MRRLILSFTLSIPLVLALAMASPSAPTTERHIRPASWNEVQVPEPVQGTWEGVWKKQGDSLKVRIEFGHQSGGWVGSFGSEDLGVLDIQLHNIVVDQESVSYDAVGDFTTTRFKGVVAGDALYGSLEELPNQP